jgi:hypothetical protein
MGRKWKRGERVVVVTINRGLSELTAHRGRKRQNKPESWAGEIVGPSAAGAGWWNVRRLAPDGRRRVRTYAVPDHEIQTRRASVK